LLPDFFTIIIKKNIIGKIISKKKIKKWVFY